MNKERIVFSIQIGMAILGLLILGTVLLNGPKSLILLIPGFLFILTSLLLHLIIVYSWGLKNENK